MSLSEDKDSNAKQLKELLAKRSSVKGRLTKFKRYLDVVCSLKLSKTQIKELEINIDKIRAMSSKFDELQAQIEVINCDNMDSEIDERDGIEQIFTSHLAIAEEQLDNLAKQDELLDMIIIKILIPKLDNRTAMKWEEHRNNLSDLPTLKDFNKFLTDRADVLQTMFQNKFDTPKATQSRQNNNNNNSRSTKSFSSTVQNTGSVTRHTSNASTVNSNSDNTDRGSSEISVNNSISDNFVENHILLSTAMVNVINPQTNKQFRVCTINTINVIGIGNNLAEHRKVSDTLKSAGFKLRKFRSNSPSILSSSVIDQNVKVSLSESTNTLGLNWNPKTDTLQISI
ncbi:hypothetical protein SFRURICE_016388, partial [Spodoptera frugiperda]